MYVWVWVIDLWTVHSTQNPAFIIYGKQYYGLKKRLIGDAAIWLL